MLNFVLAGRDTTAVTLSWFVYMMILHPEVAQKIHEELQHAYDEHDEVTEEEAEVSSFEQKFHSRLLSFSHQLTYDSLMNLHYLHASILETLRLYPAVPMVSNQSLPLSPKLSTLEFHSFRILVAHFHCLSLGSLQRLDNRYTRVGLH